jgi:hypothetical protein
LIAGGVVGGLVILSVIGNMMDGGESKTTTVTKTVTVTASPPTQILTPAPPPLPAPPPGPKTVIDGNGTYLVGEDIVPGTYRSAGGSGCYWKRLSSLDGSDIIDNNLSDGPQVVEILASDVAFETEDCQTWQKVR